MRNIGIWISDRAEFYQLRLVPTPPPPRPHQKLTRITQQSRQKINPSTIRKNRHKSIVNMTPTQQLIPLMKKSWNIHVVTLVESTTLHPMVVTPLCTLVITTVYRVWGRGDEGDQCITFLPVCARATLQHRISMRPERVHALRTNKNCWGIAVVIPYNREDSDTARSYHVNTGQFQEKASAIRTDKHLDQRNAMNCSHLFVQSNKASHQKTHKLDDDSIY